MVYNKSNVWCIICQRSFFGTSGLDRCLQVDHDQSLACGASARYLRDENLPGIKTSRPGC